MLDFYAFFVEAFYEIILFIALYIILVEAVVIRCFGVERIRGIILQQLLGEKSSLGYKLGIFTKLEFLPREI